MTFSQLRTFALVAELGSLRAAAMALGVSEPAVSAAVAALRTDLGDPLFRRTGSGIALTPGGRALAARARELVRLADRTRREVAHATSAGRLRVLATAACAEHVAGAVVAAFTRRVPRAAVDLTVGIDRLRGGGPGRGRRRHRARASGPLRAPGQPARRRCRSCATSGSSSPRPATRSPARRLDRAALASAGWPGRAASSRAARRSAGPTRAGRCPSVERRDERGRGAGRRAGRRRA